MIVKITPSDTPPSKLADAELHFPVLDDALRRWAQDVLAITYADTQVEAKFTQDLIRTALTLEGLKLVGFAVWERRTGGGRNVTFPARSYSVNGERRTFALLRPSGAGGAGEAYVRARILQAYAETEQPRG